MNTAILTNLVATLSQIKLARQQNVPVVIDHQQKSLSTLTLEEWSTLTVQEWATLPVEGLGQITVTFYLDIQRTVPAFSENTTANPESFYTAAGRVFYVPPDQKLNAAEGISSIAAQPLYFVTVECGDGWTAKATYDNRRNLLFGRVVICSKPEPRTLLNENVACLVPSTETAANHDSSDFIQWQTDTYYLYLWMDFATRAGLSEQDDIETVQTAANAVMTALMHDRYRGGASTWMERECNGTAITAVEFPPTKDYATAKLTIKCPHMRDYRGSDSAMVITPTNRDTSILGNIIDTLAAMTTDEYGAPVFEQVIVATKKNPPFAQNADQAIVVPAGEKTQNSETNDTIQYQLLDFDVYIQLNALNWGNLSELERVQRGNTVENQIKTALYADRTRGGLCTFWDKDLNGTQVEKMQLLESGTTLKGVCRVRCCHMVVDYQY